MGGTYTRGESLLDVLSLPYDVVPLMPIWLSTAVLGLALVNLVLIRKPRAA